MVCCGARFLPRRISRGSQPHAPLPPGNLRAKHPYLCGRAALLVRAQHFPRADKILSGADNDLDRGPCYSAPTCSYGTRGSTVAQRSLRLALSLPLWPRRAGPCRTQIKRPGCQSEVQGKPSTVFYVRRRWICRRAPFWGLRRVRILGTCRLHAVMAAQFRSTGVRRPVSTDQSMANAPCRHPFFL